MATLPSTPASAVSRRRRNSAAVAAATGASLKPLAGGAPPAEHHQCIASIPRPGRIQKGVTSRSLSCSRLSLQAGLGCASPGNSRKGSKQPDIPMAVEGSSLANAKGVHSQLRSAGTALLSPPTSARGVSAGSDTSFVRAATFSAQDLEHEKQHPASFYCPISRQCMHDPVVLTDGHTYERRHIEQWLKEHNTSPVSGATLESKHTFPNHAMRNAIEEYFEKILQGHRKAIQCTIQGLRRGNRRVSNELLGTIDSLMQCSILVNADLTLERALKGIMDEAKNLVGAEVASVFLVDEDRQELYSTVNSTGGELRIPIASGVAGRVASSGAPLIVRDAYCDERFNTAVDAKTGFKTRNIMCVPVQSWKWGIIGVAQLINKTSGGILTAVSSSGPTENRAVEKVYHFTDDDQHFFQVLASQAAVAIVNSGFFEMEYTANRRGQNAASGESNVVKVSDGSCSGMPIRKTWSGRSVCSECPVAIKARHSSKASCASRSSQERSPSPLRPPETGPWALSPKSASLAQPLLAQAERGWELDTLALAEFTGEKALSVLAGHLLEKLGLVRYFGLNTTKLKCFLAEIEQGYSPTTDVQYHNRAHAASVLHFTHALCSLGELGKLASNALPDIDDPTRREHLTTLACLFAAAVHDYDHVGLTNDFMVKSFTDRALRHNDRSVNESHHVSAAFEVLHKPECNFLEGLAVHEYRQFRSLVINLVLGTDMAQNDDILKRFRAMTAAGDRPRGDGGANALVPASQEEAVLALQMVLKCADLGHLALSWNLHVRWVRRLEQEFFAQGDREKESGLHDAVSFLMDRDKPGVTQSQVGFFNFVVLPLFRALADAFPGSRPLLAAVEANHARWQAIEAKGP